MNKAPNTHLLGKGVSKINNRDRVYPTIVDRDKGKRKVQINKSTWVYTDLEADEEAIERFNRVHGIATNQ